MKYLSLFSGIGGFEYSIKKVFPKAECVGYSEIDKYALEAYKHHYPEHKNFGDVSSIKIKDLPNFDLLVGGSPCQDLSISKKNRKGLKGKKSILFWDFVRILRAKKPKYFILENVASMHKTQRDIISKELGVEPVLINSSLVSAQQRKRLYWCNFQVSQPKDKKVYLKSILEKNLDYEGEHNALCIDNIKLNKILKDNPIKKYLELDGNALTFSYSSSGRFRNKKKYVESRLTKSSKSLTVLPVIFSNRQATLVFDVPKRVGHLNKPSQGNRIYATNGKSVSLGANGGGRGAKTGLYIDGTVIRKLTPLECERLQTFPDNWTRVKMPNGKLMSNAQRYKQIGNAITCNVLIHIFKNLRRLLNV